MWLYNYIYRKEAIAFLVLLASISGCSEKPPENKLHYSVSWSSEYQMVELLSKAVPINEQKDLQGVLDAPWYAEISVVNTKSSENTSFANCSGYLSEVTKKTHALRDNEINAFLEFAMMCRSTKLLLNAKSPEKSNIPNDFLNKSMLENFPVEIAFQTSTREAEKNANDKSKKYWSDINQNLQFEAISKDRVKFFDDGGFQNISLVGRGDFNSDGFEDVLISSRDSVEGGSYFNFRIFILSVNEKGEWQLIEEFRY